MINDANLQFSISLLSDWAKWLITIETGVIAIIGTLIRSLPVESHAHSAKKNWFISANVSKGLATTAVVLFLLSIAAAAFLLLSLPEIVLTIQPGENLWLAEDIAIGYATGMNVQQLAIFESMGFGLGMVCFSALVIVSFWSKQKKE